MKPINGFFLNILALQLTPETSYVLKVFQTIDSAQHKFR